MYVPRLLSVWTVVLRNLTFRKLNYVCFASVTSMFRPALVGRCNSLNPGGRNFMFSAFRILDANCASTSGTGKHIRNT